MDRQIRTLRHHVAGAVEDPAGIIAGNLEKRRIRGLGEDDLHFLGCRIERVLDHLEARGIGLRRPERRFEKGVGHGLPPAQANIALAVDPGDPARRHDDRRIHRLDDRRSREGFARRQTVAPVDGTRRGTDLRKPHLPQFRRFQSVPGLSRHPRLRPRCGIKHADGRIKSAMGAGFRSGETCL